tara:strand:+ start:483 stop:803 length:321 start_codon:yes stop_codon:yes gene_type:complete
MTDDIEEFLTPDDTTYIYYDKDGKVIVEEIGASCAYIATVKGKEMRYVKSMRGHLFDPFGMDANKINSVNTKFSKVNNETFNHYIKYLETKQNNSLTWAERSFLND